MLCLGYICRVASPWPKILHIQDSMSNSVVQVSPVKGSKEHLASNPNSCFGSLAVVLENIPLNVHTVFSSIV